MLWPTQPFLPTFFSLESFSHKKLENTDRYAQLIELENDKWEVVHAQNLEEESKLIEAGFIYVRYTEKDDVAIYEERK